MSGGRGNGSRLSGLVTLCVCALMSVSWPAGCGDGPAAHSPAPGTSESPVSSAVYPPASAALQTTSTWSLPGFAEAPFSREDPSGVVAGLVLSEPVALDEARVLGSDLGGDLIALYRTDYVWVPDINTGAPMQELEPICSRFTYVDAARIRERRLTAEAAGLAPPTMGMHISASYWEHWEEQWRQAQEPGVLFEALALYVSQDALELLRSDTRLRAVEVIEHRRTDSLAADYPGELLLWSEGFPGGRLTEPALPEGPG